MKIAFYTAMFPVLRETWETIQALGFGYLSAYLKRLHPVDATEAMIDVEIKMDAFLVRQLFPGAVVQPVRAYQDTVQIEQHSFDWVIVFQSHAGGSSGTAIACSVECSAA